MPEDEKKPIAKYVAELIKIKFKAIENKLSELEKKLEYIFLRTEELNAEDLNLDARINKINKDILEWIKNGDIMINDTLTERIEKLDSIEARYETKRDTIFKLGEVQSEMDNKQNERIELLESRDKIVINNEIFDINKKLEKLEKKIFHDYGGDLNKIEDAAVIQIELVKEISELKEQIMADDYNKGYDFTIDIQELQDQINTLLGNLLQLDRIEEVLRDHLKSHIVVAREQLTDKDKLTIFREFDNAIEKQLAKLEGKDGDSKCEFYHKDYCEPCKSPEKFYECDMVKIGNQIKIDKWKPSEPKDLQDLSEICSKCRYPFFEHVGTGREWICPEKEPTENYDINKIREHVKTKGYFLVPMADLEKWIWDLKHEISRTSVIKKIEKCLGKEELKQ